MITAMLIAALTFVAEEARAQTVALDYQQVATRAIAGATAALSLDPSRVGASAQNGVLTLVGRGPGATNVIVVVGERTETLLVVVGEPPTIVPRGMWSAGGRHDASGLYEVRYGSDPGMLQGHLRLSRREGERFTELSVGSAATMGNSVGSPFSVPLASYTVRTPDREITLFDRAVTNSSLTISRSNIRGLHWTQGPWRVHAGYSFFGNFEHLLLPTSKEAVVGAGYRYRLTPRSSLTPHLYYFDVASDRRRSGLLGSLRYETAPATDVKVTAELGISRAMAGALEIEVDRPTRRAWTRIRLAPSGLPSLTTDQQAGRQFDAGWIGYGDKSRVNASVSSHSTPAGAPGAGAYTSSVANFELQRQLTAAWTVHGGTGYSRFENASPAGSNVQSITLPIGTAFSRQHIGFGVDYQFSRETTRNLAGQLFRANLHGAVRDLRVSMFGERQTHAPTVREMLTEIPWLQPMLDRLGLAAGTPQQLADLLRTNAELSAYGYANSLQVDVTPVRTRLGANAGWSRPGTLLPQLRASTLINRDELVTGTSLGAMHSVTYSQPLGRATEVFFTWSALCHHRVLASASCRPVMFVSLRRTFNAAPGLLMGQRGRIEGVVFQDEPSRGAYVEGMPTIAGVEVVLDGERRTRTDRSGRFRFERVPYGRHQVEARYTSDRPTFFTTPSPAYVDTGAFVSFGIGRVRSSLRGTLRTDAGNGLSGVLVHVRSADRQTSVHTSDDGSFVAEGLPAGDYDVSVDASSVPVGYPMDLLTPQRVRVEDATPGRATFVLRPYRSVSGRARLFNRGTGEYVPLVGTPVELRPLQRQSLTDANGLYTFRDLPAGEYTIVAKHNGREHLARVTVPDGPALVRNLDVAVVPDVTLFDRSAPLRAQVQDERQAPNLARVSTRSQELPGQEVARPKAAAFTVDVATTANLRHARAMVDELKRGGHAAYLAEPASDDRGAYHVRVGRFSTLSEANRSAFTLEQSLGWRVSIAEAAASSGSLPAAVGFER